MFVLKKHKHELRENGGLWDILCDGFPLWKGLSHAAAETILEKMGVTKQ